GEQVQSGDVRFIYEAGNFGYLRSLLQHLHISPDSQILVFSKTSFQQDKISPTNPRAIYFNDESSVGFVPGGDLYELSSVDPTHGLQFYSLDAHEQPKLSFLRRERECLTCHGPANTYVPGIMVTSVFPSADGTPFFTGGGQLFKATDHRTPFDERWGGWYVTGTHGSMTHMGNAVAKAV